MIEASVVGVVYARSTPLAFLGQRLHRFTNKGVTIEPELTLLVQIAAAQVAGCDFCVDIGRAFAVEKKLGLEKFDALPQWQTSSEFSDRERAAIDYASQVGKDARVSDETFATLRKHFSEREIIDVAAIVAVERFYQGLTLPLGLEADGLCAMKLRTA